MAETQPPKIHRTQDAGGYRYDPLTKHVYIDIKLNYYREVFNEWDFSPDINRDLDDDLFEYLENCVMEISPGRHLHIALHMPLAIANEDRENGCTQGMRNYFTYQIRREKNRMRRTWKNALYYALFGVLFLFIASDLNTRWAHEKGYRFIVEGFFIGGWVLFWELFSILFFQVRDHLDSLRRLRRLRDAGIVYIYSEEAGVPSPIRSESF